MLRNLLKTWSKSVVEPEIKESTILVTHTQKYSPQQLYQVAFPNSSEAPA